MAAREIASRNHIYEANSDDTSKCKLDYKYFLSCTTKKRQNNYLSNIGTLAFNATGERFFFSNGRPHPLCFAYNNFSFTLKTGESIKIRGKPLEDSLTFITDSGYAPLLEILRNHQDKLHGKQDWSSRAITTCSGIQGGLSQVAEMCVDKGDPVVVQSPFFSDLDSILTPLGVEYIEVGNNEEGICPELLESLLAERQRKNLSMPKIFYINPTGANPTGELISTERKQEIYRIVCEYNLLILEDDPYYLLYNGKKKLNSFLSIDVQGRVMRFDSFSKTLGAGFRMGYITAPVELVEKFNIIKEFSTVASPFCQVVLYYTLKTIGFDGFLQHMKVVKNFYYENCQIALQSLEKYMKDIAEWKVPEAAMFIWIRIKNIDDVPQSFVEKCIQKSVFIVPGFIFYSKRKCPCIRIAFSALEQHEIPRGVERLGQLIREELLKK